MVVRSLLILTCSFGALSTVTAETSNKVIRAGTNEVVLPEPIPDRIEPVNRALWKLNQFVLRSVIQPTSKGYRAVVPDDARRGIRNVGRNLFYPRNAVNNLLQQNWTGARDETYRFLLNTTAGVGGLFDVASDYGIPTAEADLGQSFRNWGWRPQIYLMLPITGPNNERDVTGGLVDRFLHPLTYVNAPYSYASLGIIYNNLTDTVDGYVRATKSDYDPYNVLRYAFSISREHGREPLPEPQSHDIPSLETLQSVLFRVRDVEFPESGDTRAIISPASQRELPFTYWIQKQEAPLVFIAPGFGAHRLSGGTLALAELLFKRGFSVVAVSNPFNHEFMQFGASTDLPGYTPVDTADFLSGLTQIDHYIDKEHPNRITSRALVGVSMGGFHTLYLAGAQATNESAVKFDRYLAIDPPVRLNHAITRLDEQFAAVFNWPSEERTARIETTFHKVAELVPRVATLTPNSPIPLDANESRFLVGLAFKLSLRDVIFLSQSRTNMGVLREDLNPWRRDPVYHEILQFSFQDYLDKFVIPYYQARGTDLTRENVFAQAVDLRLHENVFRNNRNIRVIANANDILLHESDAQWLKSTFRNRAMLFERGGHLGNLSDSLVQQQIIHALSDLIPPL
ncbi:MAG TPA: alpha/beta fold hydrolase [Verrucomicrobiae bacterium]